MTQDEMPYERFMRCGAESLTDAELLAIIIRTGAPGRNAMEIGRRILTENGQHEPDLTVLYRTDLKSLTAISGIGEVKAVKILCLGELSKRLSMRQARPALCFREPSTIYAYYGEKLRHEPREHLILLLLNRRLTLQREVHCTIGTADTTLVPSREILSTALREGAAGFILLHNHPSGDPTPSQADIAVTQELDQASRLVHVMFHDHIIIGDTYISLRQMGYLGTDQGEAGEKQ